MSKRLALIASCLLAGVALAALGGGRALGADFPSLVVVFHATGAVTVTLPDGTPVGVTSGTPTTIAPGIYNVLIDDSAFMSTIEFDLAGPGVKLITDASRGESPSETWVETFLPSSTYTWRDDAKPPAFWTFVTSATGGVASGGSGPSSPVSTVPIASGTNGKASSTDIVGSQSGTATFRGTLLGTVSETGKLTLTLGGKSVGNLKSGRYTFSVTDKSKKGGFSVQEIRKSATTVTGVAFVGHRAATLDLKPGQWFYYPTFVGKKTYFIVVR